MTAKKTTAAKKTTGKSYEGFTAAEREAMKERASELKSSKGGEADVLAKIAEMEPDDRAMAERIHALVAEHAPDLAPKTWYGMPAYAKGGKNVVFFQPRAKFKARYATLGFNDPANLDEGSMWPTSYALTKLTAADEKKVAALIKKAAT